MLNKGSWSLFRSFRIADLAFLRLNFKSITKNDTKPIKFEEFEKCLNWKPSKGEKDFIANFNNYVIRNKNNELYIQRTNKFALNAFDDKRKYLNNIKSLLWS